METIYQPRLGLQISRLAKMNLPSFIFKSIITMSSTALSSLCSNSIISFLIADDFKLSIGKWNQYPSVNLDWILVSVESTSGRMTITEGIVSPTNVGNLMNPKSCKL